MRTKAAGGMIVNPQTPLPDEMATAHYAWREQVNQHLPDIAARVFALRAKAYRGCGFHYGLERELGYVLARMNDYETPLTFFATMVEKVRTKGLVRQLIRAEFSARGWDFPDRVRA